MRLRAPTTDTRHEDILKLEPLLRRVVVAGVSDPDMVDDLVRETLAGVIAVRGPPRRGGHPGMVASEGGGPG